MQCSNCDREFAVTDGQFCPYCGSPLNLPVKAKKKRKNDEIADWRTIGDIGNDWNLSVLGLILLAGMVIIGFSMVTTASDLNIFVPVTIIITLSLIPFVYLNSKRCERCRHWFTMKLVQHEKISSRETRQPYYRKWRQVVVEIYEDRFRCSHCGHETTRTYSETIQ